MKNKFINYISDAIIQKKYSRLKKSSKNIHNDDEHIWLQYTGIYVIKFFKSPLLDDVVIDLFTRYSDYSRVIINMNLDKLYPNINKYVLHRCHDKLIIYPISDIKNYNRDFTHNSKIVMDATLRYINTDIKTVNVIDNIASYIAAALANSDLYDSKSRKEMIENSFMKIKDLSLK